MKRWRTLIGVIVVGLAILGIIGFLQSKGMIRDFKWQGLTMIAAALAAPIKLLFNVFSLKDDKYLAELKKKQETIKRDEQLHRQELDRLIREKEQRIKLMDREVETLDTRLSLLKEKQKQVEPEISNLSDKKKQSEAQKYWGD